MRLTFIPSLIGVANAVCPYMTGELNRRDEISDGDAAAATEEFLSQYYLNDNDAFMTSDVGGPCSKISFSVKRYSVSTMNGYETNIP